MFLLLEENIFAVIDRIDQIFSVIIGKGEAVTGIIEFIQRFYRILKSSGLTDNRYGSIMQCNDLGQSTWLEERWHQERIRCCI